MCFRLYLLLLILLINGSYPAQVTLGTIKTKNNTLTDPKAKLPYLFSVYKETTDDEISTYCFSQLKSIILANKSFAPYDTSFGRVLGSIYNDIGFEYNYLGDADSAILFYKKSLDVREILKDNFGMANNFVNIGYALQSVSKYDEALVYYKKAVPSYLSAKKYNELAGSYNNIASLYNIKGNIKACIENLMAALDYYTQSKNSKGMAWIYNSLGYVYAQQEEKKLALDWYTKALDLSTKQNNKEALALIYNNLGTLEQSNNNTELSLGYYLKSLKLRRALKDIRGEIMSLNNIGNVFIISGNFQRAELYLNDCKTKCLKINSIEGLTRCYINLASLYEKWGRLSKAKTYSDSAYKISKSTNNLDQLTEAAKKGYKIEKGLGNLGQSLFYLEEAIALQDSMKSKAIQKEIYKKQYEYDLDKQEQAFEFQKREKELEVTQQKKIKNIFILCLLCVIVCGVFLARNLRQSKKKNKIISLQKDFIEDKQKEILDSITYAKRLQSAILPNKDSIQKYFKESFIFYKPKDIVAGDFYWFEKANDILFIAAADSTGHGVPGAMVSIVCSNALNKAVKEFNLTEPGAILDKTRELVLETFSQSGEEIKDGMDISLMSIELQELNSSNKKLKWAGANNPLWYISENKLEIIKPDKQPIGKSEHAVPFTTHTISVRNDAIIYLLTDGFADQFGGPKGKKFKYKQLSELLFEIKHLPLNEQQNILNKRLEDWKGQLEQIDDITIIGLGLK